jgi:ParB-like chromosome segregation protein Spo0J
LVDGHLRAKAALARGDDVSVPVVFVDLSPREERLALAAFDPIGAMALADTEVLASLREEVETEWPDSEVDLSAIFESERKSKTRGLSHTVNACACCLKGCAPGCGCWRDEEESDG